MKFSNPASSASSTPSSRFPYTLSIQSRIEWNKSTQSALLKHWAPQSNKSVYLGNNSLFETKVDTWVICYSRGLKLSSNESEKKYCELFKSFLFSHKKVYSSSKYNIEKIFYQQNIFHLHLWFQSLFNTRWHGLMLGPAKNPNTWQMWQSGGGPPPPPRALRGRRNWKRHAFSMFCGSWIFHKNCWMSTGPSLS